MEKKNFPERKLPGNGPIKKDPEKASFDKEFNAFLKSIGTLQVDDNDVVNGKNREYISVYKLYAHYISAFGAFALKEHSINYRLRQIRENDFPDDFVVVKAEKNSYEPKYFVNRLNNELLNKIFLPTIKKEIRDNENLLNMQKKDLQAFRELEGFNDEDEDE